MKNRLLLIILSILLLFSLCNCLRPNVLNKKNEYICVYKGTNYYYLCDYYSGMNPSHIVGHVWVGLGLWKAYISDFDVDENVIFDEWNSTLWVKEGFKVLSIDNDYIIGFLLESEINDGYVCGQEKVKFSPVNLDSIGTVVDLSAEIIKESSDYKTFFDNKRFYISFILTDYLSYSLGYLFLDNNNDLYFKNTESEEIIKINSYYKELILEVLKIE